MSDETFSDRFNLIYSINHFDDFHSMIFLHLLYFYRPHLLIITLFYSVSLIILIIPEQYLTFAAPLTSFLCAILHAIHSIIPILLRALHM